MAAGLGLGLVFGALGEPRAGDGDPCPEGWAYERTRIFHKQPKARIVGNKSVNGRVCLHVRRPHRNDPDLQYNDGCPRGYSYERVGIFHDSPKSRLVDGKTYQSPGWNQKRYTCLAVTRPGAKIFNPDLERSPGDEFLRMRGVSVWGSQDDMAKLRVPNESVCRAMCGAGDLCVGYLWNEKTNTCIPKKRFGRTLRHDPDTVTVLRSTKDRPVRRYYDARERKTKTAVMSLSWGSPGDDTARLFRSDRARIIGRRNHPEVPSLAKCQLVCLWHDDCEGVIYDAGRDRCTEVTRTAAGSGGDSFHAKR